MLTITQALNMRGEADSYARQEALWLLEHILSFNHVQMRTHALQALTHAQEADYLQGLMRLSKGEPLAYIIGSQPFWTLDLDVTPDTLVPRPDTEILIETVLQLDLPISSHVVDLGTGTGAIALSLAKEHPTWSVIATDVYSATLEIAQKNAQKHQLNQVKFALGAWYEALKMDKSQKFDLIVSNPPYIDPDDVHVAALHHEPKRALVAQEKGLADLRHIIRYASHWLKDQGWVVLEHGYDQAKAVQALFEQYGFTHIRSVQDYGGNDRVTLAQMNP